MWLDKPAMLIQHKISKKQKQVPQEDAKNCQIDRRPLKSNKYAGKKCQADKNFKIYQYAASEASNGCTVKETCYEFK